MPTLLNVASGPYVLEGFTNLDNSLFLQLSGPLYPAFRPFLGAEKREWVERFREAKKKAKVVRFDCRRGYGRFAEGSVDHILCSHFLEHIHKSECERVLAEFFRMLKPGGSAHIVLPDLEAIAERYLARRGDPEAADAMLTETMLAKPSRPSLLHRLLDFNGSRGLDHKWMYDRASARTVMERSGFEVRDDMETPSTGFRRDDGSLHLYGAKPSA